MEYERADVVLLCFSLVSPSSLVSLEKEAINEIKEHCPNAPCVLVGLHRELRNSNSGVPSKAGEAVRRRIKALSYVECDCRSEEELKEAILTATKLVVWRLETKEKKKGK